MCCGRLWHIMSAQREQERHDGGERHRTSAESDVGECSSHCTRTPLGSWIGHHLSTTPIIVIFIVTRKSRRSCGSGSGLLETRIVRARSAWIRGADRSRTNRRVSSIMHRWSRGQGRVCRLSNRIDHRHSTTSTRDTSTTTSRCFFFLFFLIFINVIVRSRRRREGGMGDDHRRTRGDVETSSEQ